mmetsp:Transcript_35731/g.75228  ORF Transcript_35731/g.75228 Transcript_35731/m.75228 type:complete len:97 (-) Transcript_35731:494-784(-)
MNSVDVNVGGPPAVFRENQSFKFHFHGFDCLDFTKGHMIVSPPFDRFNHEWYLKMDPGHADADGVMAALHLYHLSKNENSVCCGIAMKNIEGETIV